MRASHQNQKSHSALTTSQPGEFDFDKKEWAKEFKQLKKELGIDDRERYRPLLNIKREANDFVEEVEKEEKKAEISIKKEFAALYANIQKQKQEV